MRIYRYKIPSTFSFLIFVCFLYIIFLCYRNSFFLFPFNSFLEKPATNTFEDIYFSNGIHGWYYFPLSRNRSDNDTNSTNHRLLIVLNGNSGNISSRISIIKIIQKFFPEYDILHIDYPGFGNSINDHFPTYHDICEKSFQVYETIQRKKNYEKIGIWAEDMGCLISLSLYNKISKQRESTIRSPDWYIFYEGMFDLRTVYRDYVPFYLQMFILPFLSKELSIDHYRKEYLNLPKVCIFHSRHNRIFPMYHVLNLFLSFIMTKPQKYRLICLEGNEHNSLFLAENQEKIYLCIDNFL